MTLKTPSFWYRAQGSRPSWKEHALSPVSKAYAFFYGVHHRIKSPYKAQIPVICIGNIVAGGTGKTPSSIAFLKLLQKYELARTPYFIIRGYGGAESGPLLVDPSVHTPWDVGDEALILAQYAPTIVGADRAESVKLARKHGADLVVMDDGLQNPGIHKDMSLIVVNGEMGFGNQQLIPAGPLRQNLKEGLEQADGFILIGDDVRNVVEMLPADKPVIRAALQTRGGFKIDGDKKYLAFAGLGYPKKFFTFLKQVLKVKVVGEIAYCDHYPYHEDDLRTLDEKAKALDATLITTEKDFIRLPKIEGIHVDIVPVEMVWQNADDLLGLLQNFLSQYRV